MALSCCPHYTHWQWLRASHTLWSKRSTQAVWPTARMETTPRSGSRCAVTCWHDPSHRATPWTQCRLGHLASTFGPGPSTQPVSTKAAACSSTHPNLLPIQQKLPPLSFSLVHFQERHVTRYSITAAVEFWDLPLCGLYPAIDKQEPNGLLEHVPLTTNDLLHRNPPITLHSNRGIVCRHVVAVMTCEYELFCSFNP